MKRLLCDIFQWLMITINMYLLSINVLIKLFWQPNTTVSNSCSIGAYDGETYAIALSSCVNTSPNPDLQASAHTLTGFVTS